jgi:alkylated DNA repair dioxygenase AlkB
MDCVENYVSEEEEDYLLSSLNSETWDTRLARRVQHYGYTYDYKAYSVKYLGPLPDWSTDLAERLHTSGYFSRVPTQLIVNEYTPGQGINAHTDHVRLFGPVIASVSLGSPASMVLRLNGEDPVEVHMPRRSLVVLQGDARYRWTHEIPRRKSDMYQGKVIHRGTRVSLTFRTVQGMD